MKKKIIGIFVFILIISTYVFPVLADTIKNTTEVLLNDSAFDLKIRFFIKIAGYPSIAICIIKDDQIIWYNGYGYYDRSERKPATVDTMYILASISKTITGTALMQLYDLGLFGLDDDVNTFLPFSLRNPNFPDEPITFRMLLSHTSSLNYDPFEYFWLNFSKDPPFDFYPEQFLRDYLLPGGKFYDPVIWSTEHKPGEYAMYANVGFEIISYLIEIISKESFLDYCDTHIFLPLDMKNTGFNLSCFDIDNVAIPYQRWWGRYYTINELDFYLDKNWTPPEKYYRLRLYPAGGLYSTVSDLSHFLIAHMNDGVYNGTRILQKETVELMHDVQTGNQIDYGLAWYGMTLSGIYMTGHTGGLPGVDTFMFFNQTKNIGVIFFTNGAPSFSRLPFLGWFIYSRIIYSLFTKEVSFRQEMQNESTILSDLLLMGILRLSLEERNT